MLTGGIVQGYIILSEMIQRTLKSMEKDFLNKTIIAFQLSWGC